MTDNISTLQGKMDNVQPTLSAVVNDTYKTTERFDGTVTSGLLTKINTVQSSVTDAITAL